MLDFNSVKEMENRNDLLTHIKNIISIFVDYVKASFIDSFVVGILNFIFMAVMEMPLKILISILMAIANLIPSIGPVIGALVCGGILAFYDAKQSLYFLIFTLVLQVIDGLIIKPKIFGDKFGISGIIMLIGMIIGSALFGIPGLLLVVPAIAIVRYFIKLR